MIAQALKLMTMTHLLSKRQKLELLCDGETLRKHGITDQAAVEWMFNEILEQERNHDTTNS